MKLLDEHIKVIDNHMNRHSYERPVRHFIKEKILEGSTSIVADVGGCLGVYTEYMASLLPPKSIIYTFEPDPYKYPILCSRIKEWEKKYLITFKPQQVAISNINGSITFYHRNLPASGSIKLKGNPRIIYDEIDKIEVPSATLDTLFKTVDVDLIKMDVEGAENEAINGACELINRCHPSFMIEIHPITRTATVVEFFKQRNYRERHHGGWYYFWHDNGGNKNIQ